MEKLEIPKEVFEKIYLNQKNVEVEDGEYVKNSQTEQIQEVSGEKHEKGGVKVNLPDQSEVLSDHTKIGSKNVKKFKEEFGINIRKNNTFADVLDKYNKKLGVYDILSEEEEIYKAIEKQENNVDMKPNVKNLNLEVLQKSLTRLQRRKEDLKEKESAAFRKIFEEQEKIPKKKHKIKEEMRQGGTTTDEDLKFLSKKYGIEEDRIRQVMQQGGRIPKEDLRRNLTQGELDAAAQQTGVSFLEGENNPFMKGVDPNYPELDLGRYKDVGYYDTRVDGEGNYFITPTAKNYKNPKQYQEDMAYIAELNPSANLSRNSYIPNEQRRQQPSGSYAMNQYQEGGSTEQMRKASLNSLIEKAVSLGYKGTTDFNLDNQATDPNFKKLQAFLAKQYPEVIKDYFTKNNQPINADGVNIIKESAPELFEELGIDVPKNPADLPLEDRRKLQQAYADSGKMSDDFYTKQFADGKFLWRSPELGINAQPSVGFKNPSIETNMPNLASTQPVQGNSGEVSQVSEEEEEKRGGMGMPFIPQDFLLAPSARRGVAKQQANLGRMEPYKIGVEPNLVELESQRQAAEEAVQFLPPTQRAAAIANMLGQTQRASNQAISAAETFNTQQQAKTDQYNLQAAAKEQLLNINFNQDYENKTMRAITNQERDVRRYFNELNDQQRFNFNYIERRNMLNQAFPNFNTTTGSNIDFAGGAPLTYNAPIDSQWFDSATPQERALEQKRRMNAINNS